MPCGLVQYHTASLLQYTALKHTCKHPLCKAASLVVLLAHHSVILQASLLKASLCVVWACLCSTWSLHRGQQTSSCPLLHSIALVLCCICPSVPLPTRLLCVDVQVVPSLAGSLPHIL